MSSMHHEWWWEGAALRQRKVFEVEHASVPHAMSVPEAARRLGIGETMAWRLALRGELGSVKIGKACRVPSWEIERFLRERCTGGGDAA
jgi:excisionase family DNA binding protein